MKDQLENIGPAFAIAFWIIVAVVSIYWLLLPFLIMSGMKALKDHLSAIRKLDGAILIELERINRDR